MEEMEKQQLRKCAGDGLRFPAGLGVDVVKPLTLPF